MTMVTRLKNILSKSNLFATPGTGKNIKIYSLLHYYTSPKDRLLKTDPSECVRSSEILPLIGNYFSDVEIRPFGGGILQHAVDEAFYRRFDKNKSLHT
jgi:hypothetical protein